MPRVCENSQELNGKVISMRVLWFAVTPSMYGSSTLGHNGGGWIASLEKMLRACPEIELGVAFEHSDDQFKVQQEGVSYYPIHFQESIWDKLRRKLDAGYADRRLIEWCHKIINDFKPDVIHVFGSEWAFGLLCKTQNVPVVIHIQGIANPYLNAYFPPGVGKYELLRSWFADRHGLLNVLRSYKLFQHRGRRELEILRSCKYFMGRTYWDKSISKLYSPNSSYFYCSEALRSEFYNQVKTWKRPSCEKIGIVSTISPPLYKGMDLLLRTAQQLKNYGIDFEWTVFGVKTAKLAESFTGIKSSQVNVRLGGSVSAEALCRHYNESHVFVHTSYIDNSPNSICEAQLLGIPVVSTNVGGISSIVEDGKTGLLCPANDPFMMASLILQLVQNHELTHNISQAGVVISAKRHDTSTILGDLIRVYHSIAGTHG